MTLRRHNLALAFAAGIALLAMTSAAEAGFVSATIDGGPADAALSAEFGGTGATSSPVESRREAPSRPRQIELPTDYLDAFLGSPGPTGSMSSQSTSGPSTGAQSALATDEIDIQVELLARLGPEGRVWLPPPFSTGIFRPPRFVG